MNKKELILPFGFRKHNGWNWTLCKMLEQSNMFNVIEKQLPFKSVRGARNGNWSSMILDGLHIGLDTWDTYSPMYHYLGVGYFNKGGLFGDIKLILKIQYYNCSFYNKFEKETGICVRPWTVMPTHHFPLGFFQWENKNHRWVTTVTGKNCRFGRQPWTDWCEKHSDEYYSSGSYVVNDHIDNYLERLKECKWGMILKGKHRDHDGKNRRECEFTSLGLPLAMTYKPTYTFRMEPNEHFVLLKKPDDLALLKEINPLPYHLASKQLYYDHFSSYGMAKTLLSIVNNL